MKINQSSIFCDQLSIFRKKRHKCSIIVRYMHWKRKSRICHKCPKIKAPDWLSTESIKRFIVAENEGPLLSPIPDHFFEVSHTLLINASSDIENIDQVWTLIGQKISALSIQIKTLVKDLWDKREVLFYVSHCKIVWVLL